MDGQLSVHVVGGQRGGKSAYLLAVFLAKLTAHKLPKFEASSQAPPPSAKTVTARVSLPMLALHAADDTTLRAAATTLAREMSNQFGGPVCYYKPVLAVSPYAVICQHSVISEPLGVAVMVDLHMEYTLGAGWETVHIEATVVVDQSSPERHAAWWAKHGTRLEC